MKQISLLPIEWKREGAMGGECGDNGTYMKTIRHVNDVSVILAVTKQQQEEQVAQLWQRDRASSINDFRWGSI